MDRTMGWEWRCLHVSVMGRGGWAALVQHCGWEKKSTRWDLRNDAGFGGMSGAEGMQGTRDGERML